MWQKYGGNKTKGLGCISDLNRLLDLIWSSFSQNTKKQLSNSMIGQSNRLLLILDDLGRAASNPI